MSIPADLQRPGIRWDNIRPAPFDVRHAGTVFVKDVTGNYRPPITYEEFVGPRAEVWWLVPQERR